MDTDIRVVMVAELHSLLARTITLARAVDAADAAWSTPGAHSTAGVELAAEEARRPEPSSGSWPWLAAPMIARLALEVAAEEATGFLAVLDPDVTSYAADVLCRGVLESASLAWWLLDPGIGAEQRLARSLVYRLHSAGETDRAIKALGLGPEDDRAEYGESVADIEQEIRSLGWTCNKSWTRVSLGGEPAAARQSWLNYTERAASLVEKIWPQPKLPYALLSAVTHAELPGLQRNLTRSASQARVMRPAPGPAAALWLWQDTYLIIGALIFSADRAAAFLGLGEQLADLHALAGQLDQQLPALRPVASARA